MYSRFTKGEAYYSPLRKRGAGGDLSLTPLLEKEGIPIF